MPIRVRVSSDPRLMLLVFEGVVTAEEFDLRVVPLVRQPEFALMPLTLVDMTAAERADAPSRAVKQYAALVAENVDPDIAPGAKMALVADHDEFFGLSRMYEMHRDGSPVEIRVFRGLREAEEWLRLAPDYASRLSDLG